MPGLGHTICPIDHVLFVCSVVPGLQLVDKLTRASHSIDLVVAQGKDPLDLNTALPTREFLLQ